MSTRKTLATHSGTFHADDVFGIAVLMGVFPDYTLVRTRREERLAQADFVVDVGGEWDAARGRFDHHQRGFDGARPAREVDGASVPGVGYASAGLLWTAYGKDYVQTVAQSRGYPLDDAEVARTVAAIDHALVQYLDLVDTGQADVAPGIFGLSALISQLNTSWIEEQNLEKDAIAALQDQRFLQAVATTRQFLDQAIVKHIAQIRAVATVRQAPRLLGGRVLHLSEGGMPWSRVVVDEMPDVMLVVYPDSEGRQHQIKTVPVTVGSFDSRMDLPEAWAGLRDAEMAAVTDVPDSVFCHMNLFIAGARSLEGALRLCELALQQASLSTC